eukprot:CAMPEP_0181248230 /NCGR_PEP_ID=MMETSP1096-20121128/45051_1 /TAXON_ID=156174 ORGANISM="Chrysochromulina ericina, Strain CCMP281" /NCGR_SAMPLE_ID=MMETSP1096 /ASSEMBLY_ACC=CAM_ASM_000453 /LENGTH=82 /DNA_ID=CAMNT_0023345369 /DNA_START=12 /DNA_END=259 /DNA_ORIENTATION=-
MPREHEGRRSLSASTMPHMLLSENELVQSATALYSQLRPACAAMNGSKPAASSRQPADFSHTPATARVVDGDEVGDGEEREE